MLSRKFRLVAYCAGAMNHQLNAGFEMQPRRSSVAAVNFIAAFWAFCGLSFLFFCPAEDWRATVGVLMIAQAFTGRLVWSRFGATKSAVLPDFLTLVLFNQFVTKTLTGAGLLVRSGGTHFNLVELYLSRIDSVPMEYQFQSEIVFLMATMIFSFSWIWLERKNILCVWTEPRSNSVWLIYGVSLAIYLGLTISGFGDGLGLLLELFKLFSIGAMAVLLGGRSAYALGKPRAFFSILALLPLMVFALRSGMKAEVVLVLLPIILPIFRRMTLRRFVFLVAFLLFVVLFIFPFSNAWREANWDGRHRDQTYGVADVASRVVSSWERNGFFDTGSESMARWLSRGSSAESGGLVMQLAERDGFIGPVLIQGLTTIFIPRSLWPEKPQYAPGAWFTWYLGLADSPETASSSTAMMLPTELYWMFGVVGVVIGMAFLATLYFKVWRFIVRHSKERIVPLLALFAMLARAGGMEEVHTIYAISSPIILLAYVIVFDGLQRVFLPLVGKKVAAKGGI